MVQNHKLPRPSIIIAGLPVSLVSELHNFHTCCGPSTLGDFLQLSLIDISGKVYLRQSERKLTQKLFKMAMAKYYLAQY